MVRGSFESPSVPWWCGTCCCCCDEARRRCVVPSANQCVLLLPEEQSPPHYIKHQDVESNDERQHTARLRHTSAFIDSVVVCHEITSFPVASYFLDLHAHTCLCPATTRRSASSLIPQRRTTEWRCCNPYERESASTKFSIWRCREDRYNNNNNSSS